MTLAPTFVVCGAPGRVSPVVRYETEIWAQRRGDFARVRVADIEWVEAERDYIHLHAGGARFMLRETMAGIEARLDPEQFIRVRRSALVRVDRIARIRRVAYGDLRVALASSAELRVGRTYVRSVRDRIAGPRERPSPPLAAAG